MITQQMPRRAFTLIETLIVIAVSTSVVLALTLLIYNFNAISAYQQMSEQSSGSAGALIGEIDSLALPADAVLQTHTFSSATYTSSSTVLVLEIPSIDSSGDVIANTYDYAAFYTVGTNAYRILEANTLSKRVSGTKQLSSTVSMLTFTYSSADFTQVNIITVDIQTQTQVKQDTLLDHLREQIRLRNY
ncbi:prepilin-type N-terminal cleavage/methylation domain-containing protein [Patescibacteria group bacterium]|nr:prepilin-type N-terminal cleavage/methylation domain-containing protein [Patescibacteria group bacterium]